MITAIEAMTDTEVFIELHARNKLITEEELAKVESALTLRAACLHWTGDPLKQPPRAVLCVVRQVQEETELRELEKTGETLKRTLSELFAKGYWFCDDCDSLSAPEESDQGQPRRCRKCHGLRIRYNPPGNRPEIGSFR